MTDAQRGTSEPDAWLRERLKTAKALRLMKLRGYKPYDKQLEFHALGSTKRERTLLAGNQLGKCNLVSSYITLGTGRKAQWGDLVGGNAMVPLKSFDGQQVVKSEALPFFEKPGLHVCYRVFMSDGSWLEIADDHLLLTETGWQTFERLREFFPDLWESISESSPRARAASALRLWKSTRGFQGGCPVCHRFCDERLPSEASSVSASSPSRAGAPGRSRPLCSAGDWSHDSTSTRRRDSALLSSLDDLHRHEDPFAASSGRDSCSDVRSQTGCNCRTKHTWIESIPSSRSAPSAHADPNASAFSSPVSIDGNRIIAYESIGLHSVVDTTVPVYANYVTHGLVHHNTWPASFEAGFHLTGEYPPAWPGRVWRRAVKGWVGSESFELVRDVAQTYLLGERDAWGTGTIPASSFADEPIMSRAFPGLVDTAKIIHKSGGISTVNFKAYQQGRRRWQGKAVDFIWLDEEPDMDIYGEALARLTATGGMLYMTMTPLLGMSEVVEQFYPDPTTPQRGMVLMGIDDALHIDPEEREMIIGGYKKHEREARTQGIPMLGSGKVFDFAKSDVSCEPFEIPHYWPRLNGIDFGYGDHPTGMVQIAWDRDGDVVYLTRAVKDDRPLPAMHASTMRPWGERIRVAWPHDGHRQWGDSMPYVGKYTAEKVKMLGTHATFRSGGNSTEAGVSQLYDRMSEGRFKAFANLDSFWNEYAVYHRKDGLLVKRKDDILSALRNALMMLRYARTDEPPAQIEVVSQYDEFGDYVDGG